MTLTLPDDLAEVYTQRALELGMSAEELVQQRLHEIFGLGSDNDKRQEDQQSKPRKNSDGERMSNGSSQPADKL